MVIDVGAVRDVRGLHAVLKRELGFPSFYGLNGDAFRDAVTGLVVMPRELVFTGWAELGGTTPVGASEPRRLLRRYGTTSPGFRVSYRL
ncbi:barstar family protein [Kitasatospora sp. NPDC048722]|uniref:barstar family protein n=1 Tax=Kitasatospora sp. NPDC048722 TaxID=3155639 RepID=UPI0033F627AB